MQEQFKRSLLLPRGEVTASRLLEIQQQHPPEHLRLEIDPLARTGADKVPSHSVSGMPCCATLLSGNANCHLHRQVSHSQVLTSIVIQVSLIHLDVLSRSVYVHMHSFFGLLWSNLGAYCFRHACLTMLVLLLGNVRVGMQTGWCAFTSTEKVWSIMLSQLWFCCFVLHDPMTCGKVCGIRPAGKVHR